MTFFALRNEKRIKRRSAQRALKNPKCTSLAENAFRSKTNTTDAKSNTPKMKKPNNDICFTISKREETC